MGCGSSRPPARPAGLGGQGLPAPESGGAKCYFEFTREDPGMTLLRGIARTREAEMTVETPEEHPTFQRSATAPNNTLKVTCSSDRDETGGDKKGNDLVLSPSARSDAIIIRRNKGKANGRSPVNPTKRPAKTPPPSLTMPDKDPTTTLFLQKVVRAHENSTLFGELGKSVSQAATLL